VPFGLLVAIQNQSRDWVIDKLTVGITYDSDLERARKLIKQIGLDLANDPEFAPLILHGRPAKTLERGSCCRDARRRHRRVGRVGGLSPRAARRFFTLRHHA
jgi:small-conductance mechanosensitive channel